MIHLLALLALQSANGSGQVTCDFARSGCYVFSHHTGGTSKLPYWPYTKYASMNAQYVLMVPKDDGKAFQVGTSYVLGNLGAKQTF